MHIANFSYAYDITAPCILVPTYPALPARIAIISTGVNFSFTKI